MKEINFELKVKSGDKLMDRLEGDWDKIQKTINEKYDNIFVGKKKNVH